MQRPTHTLQQTYPNYTTVPRCKQEWEVTPNNFSENTQQKNHWWKRYECPKASVTTSRITKRADGFREQRPQRASHTPPSKVAATYAICQGIRKARCEDPSHANEITRRTPSPMSPVAAERSQNCSGELRDRFADFAQPISITTGHEGILPSSVAAL
jgi:hypothetical protein